MKILATNKEKLNAAIKEAEGRATARTIDAEKVCRVLDKIGNGITKAKLSGTKVHYTGAEHFPNSYKYRPESTHFWAENVKGKWYVVDIYRETCPNRLANVQIDFSDQAKTAIIEAASSRCI